MELTAQQVFDITPVLATLIRENRAIPFKGRYRVGRWHKKLLPEFEVISARREELIRLHGTPMQEQVTDPETGSMATIDSDKFEVKVGTPGHADFMAAWKDLGEQTVKVDMEPIPLDLLEGDNEAISALELALLGDLIADPDERYLTLAA